MDTNTTNLYPRLNEGPCANCSHGWGSGDSDGKTSGCWETCEELKLWQKDEDRWFGTHIREAIELFKRKTAV